MYNRLKLPAIDGKYRHVATNAGTTNVRVSDSSGAEICFLGTGDTLEVDKDGKYRVVRAKRHISLRALLLKMSKRTG